MKEHIIRCTCFAWATGEFPELASSIASLSAVESSLVEYSFHPHFSKESEGNNSVSIYFFDAIWNGYIIYKSKSTRDTIQHKTKLVY